MSNFKIKEISLYSFIYLIIGLIITSTILYFSLTKIKNLNDKISELTYIQNTFLRLKVNTNDLLITSNLQDKIKEWIISTTNFDKHINNYTFSNKNKIDNLWYPTKKEIYEIQNILDDKFFSSFYLEQKSLLVLKGELFVTKIDMNNLI